MTYLENLGRAITFVLTGFALLSVVIAVLCGPLLVGDYLHRRGESFSLQCRAVFGLYIAELTVFVLMLPLWMPAR